MIPSHLPSFENPPVIETVLGVQFEPFHRFKNAHLGAFWKMLDGLEWPETLDVPPLPLQFERFGESAQWGEKGIRFQLTQDPASRLQIKNLSGERMIQIQNGRLHLNWLGATKNQYPRYDNVRNEFVSVLDQLLRFIAQEKVGDFHPNQWEITYVNHIPKGTVWNSPKDWTFFKPLGEIPHICEFAEYESFGGEWHFIIPPQRGRLHIRWEHSFKPKPKPEEFIVLTFTARGTVDGNMESILRGLDLGHETIVNSFIKLMSNDARKYWEMRDGTRC